MEGWHVGRHWPSSYTERSKGLTIEDECPCPVEPCGLIDHDKIDPDCPQHSLMAGKTTRASHRAEDCPGKRRA